MGCGASSSRIHADGGKVIDAGRLMAKSLFSQKPVVGGTTADVVQGAPVDANSTPSDADGELIRKARIVQGVADSATAIITLNPVAAAGLAMIAADVAEAMPPGSDPEEAANHVASGFAASALEAAKAGSPMAEGLTEAAISAAVHVAQARSKCARMNRNSLITHESA